MKKLRVLSVIMLVAFALQACRHSAQTENDNDSDTAGSVEDTSATLNMGLDKADSIFAAQAAIGGMAEVQLGMLAVKNGRSKKVKNFGMMMIKDHGKANTKLMAIAKLKNLPLPATPDTTTQKMIAQMAKKNGNDFDKAYISNMIADHADDVKDFTQAARKIQDPDLKAFAAKTLPVLQKHLDAINAIHYSMAQ